MDRSLREMGVGDTGISKRMKQMSEAFFGRLHAYEATIGDEKEFVQSLKRNIYRLNPVDDATPEAVARYCRDVVLFFEKQDIKDILAGTDFSAR